MQQIEIGPTIAQPHSFIARRRRECFDSDLIIQVLAPSIAVNREVLPGDMKIAPVRQALEAVDSIPRLVVIEMIVGVAVLQAVVEADDEALVGVLDEEGVLPGIRPAKPRVAGRNATSLARCSPCGCARLGIILAFLTAVCLVVVGCSVFFVFVLFSRLFQALELLQKALVAGFELIQFCLPSLIRLLKLSDLLCKVLR